MRSYKQLSYEERIKLAQLTQSSHCIAEISIILGRSPSTIYRELKRNEAPPGQYWPDTAQSKAFARCKRGCILDHNLTLQEFVLDKLCYHYWTPEQISGYLRYRQKRLPWISHETIYAWIYGPSQRKERLWKFLPRRKARRGLRKSKGAGQNRIPNRVSIHERPKTVEKRKEFGHWEGDLMSFKKNSQHILVLRERKTMVTLSTTLQSKKSSITAQAIETLLMEVPKEARKTMTLDNGGEFAKHLEACKGLGMKSFFCDPYASWQKGGVENTNGRLRRDLPRKTDIKKMREEDFDEIIENYNSTPRKGLKWLTPVEAFNKNLLSVALQT